MTELKCRGHAIKIMAASESEKYLGRKFAVNDYHGIELDNRIASAWASFFKNKAVLCNRKLADLGGLAKLGTDLAVLLRTLVGPTFRTGTPALPRYAPRSVTIRGGSVEHQRVLKPPSQIFTRI